MFDFGMGELLVIGIVALIVVGPKELPVMFRTVGKFTGRMRSMARDFQRAMNDAADETGVREVSRDLKKMTSPKAMGMDKLSAASKDLLDWDVDQPKMEPTKMSEERAEAARKIRERSAEVATTRREAETKPAPAAEPAVEPAPAPAGAPEEKAS